jgi:hypothetical protein
MDKPAAARLCWNRLMDVGSAVVYVALAATLTRDRTPCTVGAALAAPCKITLDNYVITCSLALAHHVHEPSTAGLWFLFEYYILSHLHEATAATYLPS